MARKKKKPKAPQRKPRPKRTAKPKDKPKPKPQVAAAKTAPAKRKRKKPKPKAKRGTTPRAKAPKNKKNRKNKTGKKGKRGSGGKGKTTERDKGFGGGTGSQGGDDIQLNNPTIPTQGPPSTFTPSFDLPPAETGTPTAAPPTLVDTGGTAGIGGGFNPDISIAGGLTPTNAEGTDAESIARFQEQIGIGETLGQNIINQHGMGGDFLGRVDEAPSAAQQEALALSQTAAQRGSTLNPLEQEAIDLQRNALGGINATENTALREEANRQMSREFAGQQRALANIQARQGLRGGVAGAQFGELGRAGLQARRGLERDLLVENIAQKRQARQAFTDLVSGRTDAATARGLQNRGQFGAMAAGQDAFSREGQMANIGLGSQEQQARLGATLGGISSTIGTLGGFRAEDFARQQFEQGLASQRESEDKQLDFQRESLAAQERIARKFGRKQGV